MDRKQFIREQIQEGKDRESVRRALISSGESSAGLEEEYVQIVNELGVSMPKTPIPDFVAFTANPSAEVHVPLPSVFSALLGAVGSALSKGNGLLMLGIIFTIPTLVQFIPSHFMSLPIAVALGIVALFLFTVGCGVLFGMVIENTTFTNALQWSVSRFPSVLWLVLCIFFVLLGSAALFLLPLIFVLPHIIFSVMSFVREDARGMRALIRSHDLVKGNFFAISAHLLVLAGLIIAATLLLGWVLFIPIPVLSVYLFSVLCAGFAAFTLAVLLRLYESCVQNNPLFDLSAYSGYLWLYRLFFFVGIVLMGASGFVFLQNNPHVLQSLPISSEMQGEWSFNDTGREIGSGVSEAVIQSKVETTAASAKLFRGRMGFYDGVCNDITVVAPVVCKNTSEYFVVYAPLGEGSYYCVDSNNFSGATTRIREDRCQ